MSRLRYVTSFPVDKTISCCQKTKTWIDLDEYFIELMSIINYYYLFICLLFIIYYLMGRFKCKVRVWVGCRNRLWSFCFFFSTRVATFCFDLRCVSGGIYLSDGDSHQHEHSNVNSSLNVQPISTSQLLIKNIDSGQTLKCLIKRYNDNFLVFTRFPPW